MISRLLPQSCGFPFETLWAIGVLYATSSASIFGALPITFDSTAGNPNPTSQGWSGSEISLGSDLDGDGLVNSPGNAGPVAGA